jgi:hypothetical protein
MDCASKVLQITLEPKFACAHTKAETIILNVYEPRALNVLHCHLEKSKFISVLTDASSHKEIKIFPMIIMYFDYKTGLKIKMLELKSLPSETSVVLGDSLSDCPAENGLVGKVVGLCADNMNSNFGGDERKGQNSVLTKLQKNLGHGLIGEGCVGHIFFALGGGGVWNQGPLDTAAT